MKGFIYHRIYPGLTARQCDEIGYTEFGLSVRTGIYFLLGFILLVSCKKETPPKIHYYNLQEGLNPYMFKTGSYWVYKNDSTAVIDSVVVTDTDQGFFSVPPITPGTPSNEEIEYYKITLFSFLNSESFTDFLYFDVVSRNGNESPQSGQPVLLTERSIGSEVLGAYVFDLIDTLNMNGNSFYDVIQMKIVSGEQDELIFEHDTYLYYQDSIGLIKKEVDLGQGQFESWSLVQWYTNL